MLVYGWAADILNEMLRIAESTALKFLYQLAASIVAVFSQEYLRALMEEERRKLLLHAEKLRFLEMLW